MIWIVSHDAGGAEIISSWVKHHPENEYRFIISGPAVEIFGRKLKSITSLPYSQFRPKPNDFVLVGLSWDTDLERDAIEYCLLHGIRVAHYLDHWENYIGRFFRQLNPSKSTPLFPNEVWAGDEFALKIAQREYAPYPQIEVKLVPNCYFLDVASDVKRHSIGQVPQKNISVLFLSEPFEELGSRTGVSRPGEPYEFLVVRQILNWFAQKHPNSGVRQFIFRLHPAEKREKYSRLLNAGFPYPYEISQGKNIAEDLARADWVIGIKSTALALAVICKKKTFSCIPGNEVSLTLPYTEIGRI